MASSIITQGLGGISGDYSSASFIVLLGLTPSSLPVPSAVRIYTFVVGGQLVTADGQMHTDVIATKRRIDLGYESVTMDQRIAIRNLFVSDSQFSVTVPDDATYIVKSVRGRYNHTPVGGASTLWDVSATVEIV